MLGLGWGMLNLRSLLQHVGSLLWGIRTLSCCMWDLVPRPGMEPRPPISGPWSFRPQGHQRSPTKPFIFFFPKSPSSHEILMPQVYIISIYIRWPFRGKENILIPKIFLTLKNWFSTPWKWFASVENMWSGNNYLHYWSQVLVCYSAQGFWIIRISIQLLGMVTVPSLVSMPAIVTLNPLEFFSWFWVVTSYLCTDLP